MKIKTTVLLSTLVLGAAVQAQTAAPAKAPEPEFTLSANVGLVSDYRYRGISQSRLKPAVQGGVDFAHKSGFYLGVWSSSIKWIKDYDVDGPVEVDVYGGYKGSVGDLGYDVGFLRYEYVNNDLQKVSGYRNANTNEFYGALTYGPATLKYSQATSNLFGNYDATNHKSTQGSGYLDLSATFDLGNGFSLVPHWGNQTVRHLKVASYTDYSVTLGKDMGNGLSLSLALVGTDADKGFYTSPKGGYLGKTGAVLGAKYTF